MILGIGIDAAEIARFAHWHTYSDARLSRIFGPEEITYCRAVPAKSAERFAARFAAKEACYKALVSALQTSGHSSNLLSLNTLDLTCEPPAPPIPFLSCARAFSIRKTLHGAPFLHIDWHNPALIWALFLSSCHVHLSITHTKDTAIAWVCVELANSE